MTTDLEADLCPECRNELDDCKICGATREAAEPVRPLHPGPRSFSPHNKTSREIPNHPFQVSLDI